MIKSGETLLSCVVFHSIGRAQSYKDGHYTTNDDDGGDELEKIITIRFYLRPTILSPLGDDDLNADQRRDGT